jgi:hypothetical protein
MLAQVPAVSDEIIHPVSEEQVRSTVAKSGSDRILQAEV